MLSACDAASRVFHVGSLCVPFPHHLLCSPARQAQQSLRWIFVGGKGGVGKTTTSCSLAVQLAAHRKSVLLISTDPAHNLSDAFGQKFSKDATLVTGFANLFAMEIDPTIQIEESDWMDGGNESLMSEIMSSVPGIDEAMSFAELLKHVQGDRYSTIIFDTAPTGHTLRLLSFPTILEKALNKLMAIKNKFSGIFSQVQGMMGAAGGNMPSEEMLLGKLEQTKQNIEMVNRQFQDPVRARVTASLWVPGLVNSLWRARGHRP